MLRSIWEKLGFCFCTGDCDPIVFSWLFIGTPNVSVFFNEYKKIHGEMLILQAQNNWMLEKWAFFPKNWCVERNVSQKQRGWQTFVAISYQTTPKQSPVEGYGGGPMPHEGRRGLSTSTKQQNLREIIVFAKELVWSRAQSSLVRNNKVDRHLSSFY